MTDPFAEQWLDSPSYDLCRASDFELLVAAARRDPTAHVPTCPEWDVAGLCDHLARVYQGRAHTIAHGEFLASDRFEVRNDGADPVEWLQRWYVELDRQLQGHADDEPTVTFMPDATTIRFWRRRMALETLVHRTDAEVAVGTATAMDDALSADGVNELLWFGLHPKQDHHDSDASTSVLRLTDGARAWNVALGDGVYDPTSTLEPTTTVRGSAPALLLALSGRDLDGIGLERFGVGPVSIEGEAAGWERWSRRFGTF